MAWHGIAEKGWSFIPLMKDSSASNSVAAYIKSCVCVSLSSLASSLRVEKLRYRRKGKRRAATMRYLVFNDLLVLHSCSSFSLSLSLSRLPLQHSLRFIFLIGSGGGGGWEHSRPPASSFVPSFRLLIPFAFLSESTRQYSNVLHLNNYFSSSSSSSSGWVLLLLIIIPRL